LNNITGRVAREVITAGGKDQQVLDGGPNGHSYFVDYLLEALADGMADTNGDGYITFSELSSYLIPRASNRQQTPAFGVLSGHQAGEYLFRSPTARVPLIGAGEPVSGPLRGAGPAPITPPSNTDLTGSIVTGSIAVGRLPAEHSPNITPSRADSVLLKPTWLGLGTGRDAPIEMELIQTLKPDGANQHINSIAFSPDGRLLAAATDRREGGSAPRYIVGTGGVARLWDIESGTLVRALHATVDGRPPESVRGVTFSPDGKLIATSASLTVSPAGTPGYAEKRRQNLQLWNVGDGTLLQSFPTPEWGRGFDDLAFSSDGRLLAGTTEGDSSVPIWDLSSQAIIGRPIHPNSAVRLAFQPMSHVLAVADNDQRQGVLLWQANGGGLLHSLHSSPPSYGSGVAFSPDGRTLVTGHFNGRVHLWNASDGQPLLTFQLPNHSHLESFALSPDGRTLTVLSSLAAPAAYPTYELQIWDTASGKQLRLATHPNATSNLLVLDPAEPLLAVVSGDSVKVWRLGPSVR
jgi:WD40 repeat protein